MSTHLINSQAVLRPEEYRALDECGAAHRGIAALPALAALLQERFGCALTLDPDIVAGFARDSSNLPGAAEALCRPENERQAAALLRGCRAAGIPVTISGGRSNLTGSATPEGGVVLSTARMLAPAVQINEAERTVVAPVGLILEDLRKAAEAQSGRRLSFPVDPTSRGDASVGGCLACNASGFTPGEDGAARRWVQSLRVCLPDGRLIAAQRGQYVSAAGRFTLAGEGAARAWPVPTYARPAIKNAGGPFSAPDGVLDLVDLMIGSEGIFGLVTACTLDLAPRPAAYLDLFFSLPGEAEALRLLDAARAHFHGRLGALTAFEYFGVNARRYMKHEERFFRGADPVGVYIQQPLRDADTEAAAQTWLEILAAAQVTVRDDAILILDTDALRAFFMEARHSMPANTVEVVQRRGTFTIMTDCVVPPERFAEFLRFTHARIAREGLDYLAFGHFGDCHLHFTILPTQEQVPAGVAAYDDIVAKSAELGGVYSGEHGTGKRKRQDFLRCYGPAAAEQVRRCKAAVDPEFLLNRGTVCSPQEGP